MTKTGYKLMKSLRRNSSAILTVASIIGVGVTAILSAQCKGKADARVAAAEEKKGGPLTKTETIVNAGIGYLPAITSGIATACCMSGAHILDKQRQGALMSAYGLLSNYHKNYVDTLVSLHGKEADLEVKEHLTRTNCDYHVINADDGAPKMMWFDDTTGESFIASEKEVMDAEYHFNRNYVLHGLEATVNEWREMLGLPLKEGDDEIGWTGNAELYWVDFEHYPLNPSAASDGAMPKVCISAVFPPEVLEDYD